MVEMGSFQEVARTAFWGPTYGRKGVVVRFIVEVHIFCWFRPCLSLSGSSVAPVLWLALHCCTQALTGSLPLESSLLLALASAGRHGCCGEKACE